MESEHQHLNMDSWIEKTKSKSEPNRMSAILSYKAGSKSEQFQ